MPDYTGVLRKLRLDIGTKAGEEVTIHSLKAVSLATDVPAVKLDHTYHLYADKLNDVIRLVANGTVRDLAAVGTVTRLATDTVEKLILSNRGHFSPTTVKCSPLLRRSARIFKAKMRRPSTTRATAPMGRSFSPW